MWFSAALKLNAQQHTGQSASCCCSVKHPEIDVTEGLSCSGVLPQQAGAQSSEVRAF